VGTRTASTKKIVSQAWWNVSSALSGMPGREYTIFEHHGSLSRRARGRREDDDMAFSYAFSGILIASFSLFS
jgi:hypothetical protein